MTNIQTTTIIRDVPLAKLVASDKNVRRTGRDAGIEELAASIAAHGLLQSLSVRPVLNADGMETGKFSVTGGGRRLAALKLLAKRKAIAKSYAVPCLINEGDEEEVSLAENVVREPLHPADQFEAFKRLADEQGFGAEEIAARFGVTPHVVRQRLRLGAISPRLMQVYRDGGLTLDQLTAFAISEDHARQEQVYDNLSWNKEPHSIRRMMTETHVRASDRRAAFVGADAYTEAGGVILRDLFSDDDGGYFEDGALLDRLALEKLERIAEEVRAEGWKWAQAFIDFPHAHGLHRTYPQPVDLTPEDQERLDAVQAEFDALNEQYDGAEELADEVDAKFGALEAEIERLSERQYVYEPDAVARSGVFVVLNHDGAVRIERGFVRPEDETPEPDAETGYTAAEDSEIVTDAQPGSDVETAEDEDTDDGKPLSDLLIRDLTAHRTLGLRLALGENPDVAMIVVTHALAAQTFYRGHDTGSCLDLTAVSAPLGGHADGIEDTEAGKALADRHATWAARMPQDAGALWGFVVALDYDNRMSLFAHCAALTVFAVKQPWDRKPRALATADRLAQAVSLDMTAHWRPTARTYLGRVTKAQIVEAVRDGVSEDAA
ncbi:MAG: ParB N-terminal domain-containing protein, partial [Alphaproteobacteria bacterium]|nr:ParB N-terminal domain-containing protein [Alphaproteobacteria bacterium]